MSVSKEFRSSAAVGGPGRSTGEASTGDCSDGPWVEGRAGPRRSDNLWRGGLAAWREILLPGQATRRGAAHVGQPFFRLHSSDYPLVLFLHDWQFGSELASCSLQRIVWHSSLSPLFSSAFFLQFLTRLKGRSVCIFYTLRTVRESG